MRRQRMPRRLSLPLRVLRILVLAVRNFDRHRCSLRASALTVYALLSLVPVLAVAFGLATGFGFEQKLEWLIAHRLQAQEQVVLYVIGFARSLLHNTSGGLIAGAGVLALLWTAIKLLGDIESSFNEIWGVKVGRTWSRRLSDYIAIMVIAPILLVASSSLTVFVTTQVLAITERLPLIGRINDVLFIWLNLLPYAVVWLLFTFLYKVMPNTPVRFGAALLAGAVAGTMYQLVQWAYVAFQIGVARYNAIYGSFAALPLFIVWLQLSWLVVLFGAEIAFATEHEQTYEFERESLRASERFRKLIALRIAAMAARRFAEGQEPLSAPAAAEALNAPIRLVRSILDELVQARVLTRVAVEGHDETEVVQPACDAHDLTIWAVMDRLNRFGHDEPDLVDSKQLESLAERLAKLEAQLAGSPDNVLLKDL